MIWFHVVFFLGFRRPTGYIVYFREHSMIYRLIEVGLEFVARRENLIPH